MMVILGVTENFQEVFVICVRIVLFGNQTLPSTIC